MYIEETQQLFPQLTGRQKLTLLRHWLDQASADDLDTELQVSPDVSFDSYWARLDLSFGAEDQEALRRQLRSLQLNTRGKLTEREWREFSSRA